MSPGASGTEGAQAVRRAIELLRLVATGQEQGVRLTDLVAMSGLTRPTVHRLLKALIEEQAVEQDGASRRYRVGTEMLLLGLARRSGFPVRAAAEPSLRGLAGQLGDTVFLSLRHGADSVCIDRFLGTHPIQVLSIEAGARRPLGVSVSGVMLLAGLAPELARGFTQGNATRLALRGLDFATVLQRVQTARELGYAYADAGVMPGTRALGIPLHDGRGEPMAAISVAALAERLDPKRVPEVLTLMRQAARAIEARMAELRRS